MRAATYKECMRILRMRSRRMRAATGKNFANSQEYNNVPIQQKIGSQCANASQAHDTGRKASVV